MPLVASALDEVEVVLVVEEELRDQELRAGRNLVLAVAQVGLRVGRLGVGLRVAGAADAEVVRLRDQRGQLGPVRETAGDGLELGLPLGRVAPQGEHVLDAGVAHLAEHVVKLLARVAHAGEMRHRLDAELVLDALHDVDRERARAAARAIGDGDEGRARGCAAPPGLEQLLLALRGLGREELEREARPRAGR